MSRLPARQGGGIGEQARNLGVFSREPVEERSALERLDPGDAHRRHCLAVLDDLRVGCQGEQQSPRGGRYPGRDNVFVERLWKSVKYAHVYLHAYETTTEARAKLAGYLDFYNRRRPHSSLDRQAPDDVCFNQPSLRLAA